MLIFALADLINFCVDSKNESNLMNIGLFVCLFAVVLFAFFFYFAKIEDRKINKN